MAQILSHQKTLTRNFWVRVGPGVALIGGALWILSVSHSWIPLLIAFGLILTGSRFLRGGVMFLIGAQGEDKVTRVLQSLPESWYVFNDLTVNGAQIDHVLIGPKGIFTIETKNYSGKIYGNANQKQWTYYLKNRKYTFYNPVKQALKHSLVLSQFLETCGLGKTWVETLVVFAHPQVKLKIQSPKVPVLHLSELREYLLQLPDKFSPKEVEALVSCLQKLTSPQI